MATERPFYLYRFIGDNRFIDFNRNVHHTGDTAPEGYEFLEKSFFRNAPEHPVEIYKLKESFK